MQDIAARRTSGFSQGERVKTAIARALVHGPRNVLLDEPTNGLDVTATRSLREFLRGLKAAGCCVLLSTHLMQEVAALCDRIVIIAHGRVVADGTADALRARAAEQNLEEAFVKLIGAAAIGRCAVSAALTVFIKECRESLRDRRVLINSLLLGPLIGPLLFLMLMRLVIGRELEKAEQPLPVVVIGAERAPELIGALRQMGLRPLPPVADPELAVREQRIDLALRIAADYGAALAQRASGAGRADLRLLAPRSAGRCGAAARHARELQSPQRRAAAAGAGPRAGDRHAAGAGEPRYGDARRRAVHCCSRCCRTCWC